MLTYRSKVDCFRGPLASLAVGGLVALVGSFASAQTPTAAPSAPVIYPAKGQSDAQQQQDKSECYAWATKQTGYDPVQVLQQQQAQQTAQTQQAQAAPPPPQGQVAGGAARGAAGGALIGAAAGDAGKGAAIGATVGAVSGSAKKRRQADAQAQAQQQQAAQQAQQNAANNAKLADYQKNFGACMQGRGYGVS
jgi:YMGG-like Gly-zipper